MCLEVTSVNLCLFFRKCTERVKYQNAFAILHPFFLLRNFKTYKQARKVEDEHQTTAFSHYHEFLSCWCKQQTFLHISRMPCSLHVQKAR